ncbi:hypothetical protein ACHAXR_002744, partial [Thalassiosira sp. AJA248-18]
MIRASKLVSHATRRLQNSARPSLASTTHASSAMMGACASMGRTSSSSSSSTSSSVSSGENWLINLAIGAAASVSALGVGIAAQSCMNERTIAKCEQQTTSSQQQSYDDDDEDGKTHFQTISKSELNVHYHNNNYDDYDGGKSERAFASALENSLFNVYEDGADDWEEAYAEDATDTDSRNNNNNEGVTASNENDTSNAVMEHFVSFSPPVDTLPVNLQPRMSIRHTNRRPMAEEAEGEKKEQQQQQQQQRENSNLLLATSDKSEASTKSTTTTTPTDGDYSGDVLINRINTVRRNDLGHNQVYTKKMYFYQSAQVKAYMSNKFRLFALPSSINLGKEMAYLLGTNLNCLTIGSFTDGETSVKIDDAVRGKEVFVVCTTTSTNSIMELLLSISALRRGSAKRICAVIPYYGYSRQDRRTGMKRE